MEAAGSSAGGGTASLLERDAELAVIAGAVSAAAGGRGRLVLVEGHAGVGKTRLLDAAVERAGAATVLRAGASEHESAFAFGVALQLFEPLLHGLDDQARDRLLTGSAGLAAPLLERPTAWAGDEREQDVYPVMHGLYWLLANLAEAGPVLVVVDDAHWADRPSLRLLLYLLQRLEDLGVALLAARRLGEPGAPDDLLGQLGAHARTVSVRPAGLGEDGCRTFVRAVLPRSDDAFASACRRMTDGNPFLLGELVGAVAQEGFAPTGANAARLGTLAPEAVLRAVAVRLMRLSDEAAGVARAVAVLGEDAELRRVVELTGRDPVTVAAAADGLAAGEILRPASGAALAFTHPLLASAVYADVGSAERATLHRRAAGLLEAEGAAPQRVAAHLLPSPGTGEPWAVAVLRLAAARAAEQGAPESAAAYLARALHEPPSPSERAGVLRELGVAEAATALPGAAARLADAVACAAAGPERAEALAEQGRALGLQGRDAEAVAALGRIAGEPGVADELREQARAEALALGLVFPARRAAVLADDAAFAGGAATDALAAASSLRDAMLGRPRAEVAATARAALASHALLDGGGAGASAFAAAVQALIACDELDEAASVLGEASRRARTTGSTMALASSECLLALVEWGFGRLAEAQTAAGRALAAERHGWGHLLTLARGIAVGVAVDRGALDEAEQLVAMIGGSRDGHDEALGRLAAARRRDAAAVTAFEAWRETRSGIVNPACRAGWRSALAPLLARRGDTEQARELVASELSLAREFGAPRAISVALRALVHVSGDGDMERNVERASEAVDLVADGPARLEHARARCDLGIALRRAGRRTDAGRELGLALELAQACGARPEEQLATAELEALGARGKRAALRGADALSPGERRVVALAVEGMSNREIAEALFVTRKAVEWHLGNAYRKLEVKSRRELPDALAG